MASRFGSTSRVQKSSVALAMARCSAVKSSGVNTSCGASSRKEPPKGVDMPEGLDIFDMLEFMKSLPFLLGTLSLWGQAAAPDPVVLTVGSEKITQSMFQEIIASLPAQQQAQLSTPEARRSLAEQVAELKVMAQEARARKLDQSAAVKAKVALQSDQILANAVYQELTAGNADEASMRAYYAEHKQDWDQVKARHILIRMQVSRVPVREGHKDLTDAEALAKAKEVRAKIVAGAKFEDQAKGESDDVGSGENG